MAINSIIVQKLSRSWAQTDIFDFEDLVALELKGDNLRQFPTEWDKTLLGMKERPKDEILESLYRKQIKKSAQFRMTYALYVMESAQYGKEESCERLRSMVAKYLRQLRKDRNGENKESGYANVTANT